MEIFYGDFECSQEASKKTLSDGLKDPISDFKAYFDLQQTHTYEIAEIIIDKDLQSSERVLFHCIIKSSHLIFSANKLVLSGDFGIARILFREIFEYLLVGKYIYYNRGFADKWLGKEEFKVKRQLWDRLKSPKAEQLITFWNLLCNQAHSKVNSGQIGIRENDYTEVLASFKINLLLLRLKKHLIELFTALEFELRPAFFRNYERLLDFNDKTTMFYEKKLEVHFIEEGIKVINDYCENWNFNE